MIVWVPSPVVDRLCGRNPQVLCTFPTPKFFTRYSEHAELCISEVGARLFILAADKEYLFAWTIPAEFSDQGVLAVCHGFPKKNATRAVQENGIAAGGNGNFGDSVSVHISDIGRIVVFRKLPVVPNLLPGVIVQRVTD